MNVSFKMIPAAEKRFILLLNMTTVAFLFIIFNSFILPSLFSSLQPHAHLHQNQANLDYWYEINITNAALNFTFRKDLISEIFPGRLFTTRMPRNVSSNSDSANYFRHLAKLRKLSTVVVLTETFEFDKYAGADLKKYYKTIPGLQFYLHPIVDFSIPKKEEFLNTAKFLLSQLCNGNNVIVHCAGGNGRTGTVIAGLLRIIGQKDPIDYIRKVKPAYVETLEQENFVSSLPSIIDLEKDQNIKALIENFVNDSLEMKQSL